MKLRENVFLVRIFISLYVSINRLIVFKIIVRKNQKVSKIK